jgi:ABC-2 type transport system permease protein
LEQQVSAAPTASYSPVSSEPDVLARRQGFGHLMLAEWTKIRSVRSTAWTLILFVVITIGLTALFSWITAANWNGPHAAGRDITITSDPVGFIFGAGIGLGQLTICVLGVLVITTEYSSGVIRASLLAVPRRFPMLAAKVAIFGLLTFVLAEIVAFGSFYLGSTILHSHVAVSLSDPGVLRATLGAGLYLTVLGLLALGIGALFRHTAGAISTVIGVVLVLPILTGLLPSGWFFDHLNAYLPEQAGSLIFAVHQNGSQLLTAWEGFGVLCIWAALVLGVAAYLLDRRDA